MVYQPDPPFPKTRGNAIRAKDWNDTINEVVRLDQTKLGSTGGTVTGNLAVTGNLTTNGTISGNLAANTVGTSQIANRSVTTDKLADNSIYGNHISAGVVPVNRLIGYYPLLNFELTVPYGTARAVHAGLPTPAFEPMCPLVFYTATARGAIVTVEYSVQFLYIDGDGGAYQVEFRNVAGGVNTVGATAVVFATIFAVQR